MGTLAHGYHNQVSDDEFAVDNGTAMERFLGAAQDPDVQSDASADSGSRSSRHSNK